jgi:hypothetical protein
MPSTATAESTVVLGAIWEGDGRELSVAVAVKGGLTPVAVSVVDVGCGGRGDSLAGLPCSIGVPALGEQAATRSAARARVMRSLVIVGSSLMAAQRSRAERPGQDSFRLSRRTGRVRSSEWLDGMRPFLAVDHLPVLVFGERSHGREIALVNILVLFQDVMGHEPICMPSRHGRPEELKFKPIVNWMIGILEDYPAVNLFVVVLKRVSNHNAIGLLIEGMQRP